MKLTVPKAPSESLESILSLCLGNSKMVVSSRRFFNAVSASCCVGDYNQQKINNNFEYLHFELSFLDSKYPYPFSLSSFTMSTP